LERVVAAAVIECEQLTAAGQSPRGKRIKAVEFFRIKFCMVLRFLVWLCCRFERYSGIAVIRYGDDASNQ